MIFGKNFLYHIKTSIDRQRGLQPLGMLPPSGGFWDGPVSQRGRTAASAGWGSHPGP